MTLKEAYQYGDLRLSEAGIEESRIDAWLLLEHVTGITRARYYVKESEELTSDQEEQYLYGIERRTCRIPLQHITGVQEFMGLSFQVNEHVLIPRQDTETLVEEALHALAKAAGGTCKVLDMCTGSGCVLLSILHHGAKVPDLLIQGTGVDISEKAICVASQNAQNHSLEAAFHESDLFEKVEGRYQLIVSNPPYIPTKEIERLQTEVKAHDPMLALDGMEDGLHFYRRIIAEAGSYLEPGGQLMFEIGWDQGEAVSTLMTEAGYSGICVKKDLSGLDRVVIGVYDRYAD